MNFQLFSETDKISEINFIMMPLHYVLVQVFYFLNQLYIVKSHNFKE